MRLICQPRNGGIERAFAEFVRIDLGQVLQLKDHLSLGIGCDNTRDSFSILFVLNDLPGKKVEDMLGAEGRATIGIEQSLFRFVEHCPYLQSRTETPAMAMQHAMRTSRLTEYPLLMSFLSQGMI